MSIGELYDLGSSLLDLLDCSIREYALLLSIWEETLNGTVRKADLLGSINEVLLNLAISELEHLEAIWESRLRGLGVREEVHDLPVREGLLDVVVVEVDYRIAIRPYFPLQSIREDHFLLPVLVNPLDLPIVSNDFFRQFVGFSCFSVILTWEFKVVFVFFGLLT